MTEEQVFLAALDLPDATARGAYLDEACGDDAGLRGQVEALLASHFRSGEFLDVPAAAQISVEPSQSHAITMQSDFMPPDKNPDDESDSLEFLTPPTRPDSFGRLGHYEVLQVLGKGGFGTVLRAFDDVLQRIVAVKVMAPQLAATSPARKRFLREARMSAQVRHENVVQVYEVGEQPLPYLVMEFIPGETLQQRLDRVGPLDVPESLRIGRQIAEGLAAAHATDLIHRDIKPGNVLLEGGQLKVKITDFGLARAADDASMTQSGQIAGTPMYMAPEQALGQTLDQRADLFSLGSVLYQMVAGRAPFRANTAVAVLKRVAEDTPRNIREVIPETPQWLCDIIAKLHAKNPDDRYQSAREVADVLADCEAQLKASSRLQDFSRIPRGSSTPRTSGQRRWVAAAAVLLLPVIALAVTELAGVTHLFRGQPATPEKSPAAIAPVTDDAHQPIAASPAGQKGPYLKKSLPGHASSVFAVVYSPDGRLLASGGTGDVRVWDTQTEKLRYVLSDIRDLRFLAITFSPDSKYLLTAPQAGATPTSISIWEARSGEPAGVLEGHGKGLFDLSFSPDGKTLVSGGWEDFFRVWDFEERRKIRDIPSPTHHYLRSAVFSSQGKIAFGQDKVFLCEPDGSQVRTINKHAGPLCFSPDGNRLAGTTWAQGFVTVWDVDTGNEIASWHAHQGTAEGVAFSRDGKVLATAGNDCTVRLWDYESQFQLAELPNDAGANGVAFSPDGITLATVGHDRLVKLWDVSAILAKQKEAKTLPRAFKNSIGMEFVIVPKGKSWLGGGKDKLGDQEVEIPADFYLGKYEVTQEEWEQVMGENPSHISRTGTAKDRVNDIPDADLKRFPVENVSWDQCQLFVAKLNSLEKETGWVYRLPKETEWEYACRGGPMADKLDSAFDWYFARPTNTLLPEQANFNSGTQENVIGLNRTSKVGSYEPNVLGLYDMHGNVHELCDDTYTADDGASMCARRGGSWFFGPRDSTAALRAQIPRSDRYAGTGLRLARVPSGAPSPAHSPAR